MAPLHPHRCLAWPSTYYDYVVFCLMVTMFVSLSNMCQNLSGQCRLSPPSLHKGSSIYGKLRGDDAVFAETVGVRSYSKFGGAASQQQGFPFTFTWHERSLSKPPPLPAKLCQVNGFWQIPLLKRNAGPASYETHVAFMRHAVDAQYPA